MSCSVEGCSRSVRTKDMCVSHYASQWNQEHREQYNQNWKNYYERNAEARRRSVKSADLKKLYNMSIEDYDALLLKQNGVCAICGREERHKSPVDNARKALAVDHDHETGQVRGLLCASCNRGLGWFGEDAKVLRLAADYIELKESL